MSTNVSNVENLAVKLKSLGQDINETALISRVMGLTMLPSNYNYFVRAWESTNKNDMSLVNLTARLIAEESRFATDQKDETEVTFQSAEKKCYISVIDLVMCQSRARPNRQLTLNVSNVRKQVILPRTVETTR